MRMLEGIERPASPPSARREGRDRDARSRRQLECDADNLVEFAVMGSVFAQALLGLDCRRSACSMSASEELKGHEELRKAAALLRRPGSPVNFHGFVEGDDIGAGTVDVVVTDGFTGNIALKAIEGTAKLIRSSCARRLPDLDFRQDRLSVRRGAFEAAQADGSAPLQWRRVPRPQRHRASRATAAPMRWASPTPSAWRLDMVRYAYKNKIVEGLAEVSRRRSGLSTPGHEALQASGGTA
jgi:glycerol-3-phosphate acyltransferase PlsX